MISVVTEEEHKETCCIVGTNSRIIHDLSEKADRFEAAIEELERRINVVADRLNSQAGKSVECPWCGGMNTGFR